MVERWLSVWVLSLLVGVVSCGGDHTSANAPPAKATATDAGTGAGGAPPVPEGEAPTLPTATEACPTLATGPATFLGQQVELWVGEKQEGQHGFVFFYWHGTGTVWQEGPLYWQAAIDEIVAGGGVFVSFVTSTGTGDYTGPFVWHSDDFAVTDEIVACAVEQLDIDPKRIYSAGCSAGGLQTSAMAYLRSGYVAAATPNSGGTVNPPPLQDPSHVPPVMTTHGAPGLDVIALDFSVTSATLDTDITAKGGFAVDCNHGGGHCGAPADVIAAQWQFIKDHPFGVAPEPYADALPSGFPSYCAIAR